MHAQIHRVNRPLNRKEFFNQIQLTISGDFQFLYLPVPTRDVRRTNPPSGQCLAAIEQPQKWKIGLAVYFWFRSLFSQFLKG